MHEHKPLSASSLSAKELMEDELHIDPISHEPGAHPVGTGLGAVVGGAATGFAGGVLAGPIGAVVGLIAGAIAGGIGGKVAAEALDPTEEETFWQQIYEYEPYYIAGKSYADYAPAYGLGYHGRAAHHGQWVDIEPELASQWDVVSEGSTLNWLEARSAAMAAWQRLDARYPHHKASDEFAHALRGWWHQAEDKIKAQLPHEVDTAYPELFDQDDLSHLADRREIILGRIQAKYGLTHEEAEKRLQAMLFKTK